MKFIGTSILVLIALFALGTVLAPLVGLAYLVSILTLSQIVKGAIILYLCLIPISVFAQPR